MRLTKREKQLLATKSPQDVFWTFREKLHYKHGWKNYMNILKQIQPAELEQLLLTEQWQSFQRKLFDTVRTTLNDMAAAEVNKFIKEVNDGKI